MPQENKASKMGQEIKAPAMGESITEAVISAILKPAGTQVKIDDEIFELATDKVNQVLYAPCAGIFYPKVKEEDVVRIGAVLGIVEPLSEGAKAEVAVSDMAAAPAIKPSMEKAAELKEPARAQLNETVGSKSSAKTSPAGTSAAGTSTARKSVVDFFNSDSPPQAGPEVVANVSAPLPAAFQSEIKEERRKMSRIRQVIASRLVEVQHQTASLTTFNEVDLTAIMEIRERNKDSFQKEFGIKLGLMSFFVKASIAALKKFPALNSYIDGDDIVERRTYSIGVAVGTDKGVVVPVLQSCDHYSFAEIEKQIATFATKIKEGKISADDLRGAGFTISNGGVYGSLLSTPILSPNQCAILGMHKIQKRPVVIDDQIVARQMMYLALTYDHRIVDGKEAVSFLVHIKNLLEDPSRILF